MTLPRAIQSLVEDNREDHTLFLQVSHLVKETQWKCTHILRTKLSLWLCLLLYIIKLRKYFALISVKDVWKAFKRNGKMKSLN